jgi:hypothetical protein
LSGAAGVQGPAGAAATIAVGFVSTGAAGSNVVVTNTGTSSAAVFDFAIPRGDTGSFVGDASTITAGTLSDARLSANATLGGNVFSGTGSMVRQTSPALVTPNIGAASASSVAISQAGVGQLTVTSSVYTGATGDLLKCVPHTGSAEPLSVRNYGGHANSYSTRADSIHATYLGLAADINVTGAAVLTLADSRPRLGLHNGANAYPPTAGLDLGNIRLFNAYTDASNYERGNLSFASNTLTLASEAAGTGTVRGFQISIGGTPRFAISTGGDITTGTWQAGTIAVTYGGTGATTAAAARTNLGLVIGTDVQAFVSATSTGTGGIVRANNAELFDPTLWSAKLRGYSIAVQTFTTGETLTNEVDLALVDASSGPIIITISSAPEPPLGKVFEIKRIDASANTVTIDATSIGGIDGQNTVFLPLQNMSLTLVKTASGIKVV